MHELLELEHHDDDDGVPHLPPPNATRYLDRSQHPYTEADAFDPLAFELFADRLMQAVDKPADDDDGVVTASWTIYRPPQPDVRVFDMYATPLSHVRECTRATWLMDAGGWRCRGVGASCIYPLLGHRLYGWRFVGSDINAESVAFAKLNVRLNRMEHAIDIRCAPTDGHSILGAVLEQLDQPTAIHLADADGETASNVSGGHQEFECCMCNPPFFASLDETGLNKHRVCTGTANELVTVGGELSFISRLMDESTTVAHRFRWFTSMVGKKAHLAALTEKLRSLQRPFEHRTTEFYQGHTTRWAIAWRFIRHNERDTIQSSKPEHVAETPV